MMIDWRLPELMRMRGLKSTAALYRRLVERRGAAAGLSQAQVYRLADGGPELLNLSTLEALCTTLDVTPAELLTNDIAGVPNSLLSTLLVGFALSTAHSNLCGHHRYRAGQPNVMMSHPGDSFGKVLAWLWRSGREQEAVTLVADLLAEMRQHNPYAPEPGGRLVWKDLAMGIRQAINAPYDLSKDQVDDLLAHLEAKVPAFYGTTLAELSTP